MEYRLFLDDERMPQDVGNYIYPYGLRKEYLLNEWVIVRNYPDFTMMVTRMGLPTHVSFDHDLAPKVFLRNLSQTGEMNYKSKDFLDLNNRTGYHAAKWLIDYVMDKKLQFPTWYVHSLNPVGKENIESLINNFLSKIYIYNPNE